MYGQEWIMGDLVGHQYKSSGLKDAVLNARVQAARYQTLNIDIKRCLFQEDNHYQDCSKVRAQRNANHRVTVNTDSQIKQHCVSCEETANYLCRAVIRDQLFFSARARQTKRGRLKCTKGSAFIEEGQLARAKYEATNRSLENLALGIAQRVRKDELHYWEESGRHETFEKHFRSIIIRTNMVLSGVIEESAYVLYKEGERPKVEVKTCIPRRHYKAVQTKFKRR